jgi:amino acid transporter
MTVRTRRQDRLNRRRQEGKTLARGRLGVFGVTFFAVAAAAPLVGMTGGVPVGIVLGVGPAVPGAYLVVGLTLLLFSVGYSAMSHKVTNTGAFFAFVGRGLGVTAGVASAFVSVIAYLAIQLSIYGFIGPMLGAQLNDRFGLDQPWWAWSVLSWLVVLGLSLFSVDVGARLLGALLILEVLSLALMTVAVFVSSTPEGLDLAASFAPDRLFEGGFTGSAGIALTFAFASFVGFEATAIYGEESRDPKRTVPRATYLAVGAITTLFVLTSLAVVTGLGATKVGDEVARISSVGGEPLADPAAVLYAVADRYVGDWLGTTMSWLIISSLFAGLLAFQNCTARYLFAMGRAGVLPARLGTVNRLAAPAVATVVTSAITLVVIAVFALADLDPVLNLFYWLAGTAVIAIVLVEILVSIAVIRFFRIDRSDTRIWNTVIAPVLAVAGLLAGLYLLIARFGLLAGTAPEGVDPSVTAWSLNTTGWILVALPFVTLVVGAVVGLARRENGSAVADLVT